VIILDFKVYTVKEVCKLLNLGEYTVRDLIRQNKLKKIPIAKPIRISQKAINEFLGYNLENSSKSDSNIINFKKNEIMNVMSIITDIQASTNKLLVLFQNKLK
jgi:excisionase family DNA binding protein